MARDLRTRIEQAVADHVHVASESAAAAEALYDLVSALLVEERISALLTAAELAQTPDDWSGQDSDHPVSDDADEAGEKIATTLQAMAAQERARAS